MDEKKHIEIPVEIHVPEKHSEIEPPLDPEEPLHIPPEEIPDIVPEEDPFEDPPYEIPALGEGP